MMPVMRGYQAGMLERISGSYRTGHKAPLVQMATGAGKTPVLAEASRRAAARGKRILVVAHRRELIKQASRKLSDAGLSHGIIAPGFTATRDAVQVGSVQTLAKRLDRIGQFDLLVFDECHHASAGQWSALIAAQSGARLLGVTATPERLDGQGLGVGHGGPFDDLLIGPSVAELIEGGFLVPAHILAPGEPPDLSGIRTRGGDYAAEALAGAMGGATITGDAVEHYRRYADGLPAIAFCVTVQHAQNVAATFQKAGYRAVAASGDTPADKRDAAINGLGTGAVQVLCACDLISEGLDVPAVGAVILLRPTQSLGLHLQQVGRGLRPATGKSRLVVLDHAGNSLRHGLPDSPREWSLAGRPKKKGDVVPSTWRCFACFAIQGPKSACGSCGIARPAGEARELIQAEGDLVAVDPERVAHLRRTSLHELLAGRPSRAELQEIARAKGYRPGWVHYQMQERHNARAGRAA